MQREIRRKKELIESEPGQPLESEQERSQVLAWLEAERLTDILVEN